MPMRPGSPCSPQMGPASSCGPTPTDTGGELGIRRAFAQPAGDPGDVGFGAADLAVLHCQLGVGVVAHERVPFPGPLVDHGHRVVEVEATAPARRVSSTHTLISSAA